MYCMFNIGEWVGITMAAGGEPVAVIAAIPAGSDNTLVIGQGFQLADEEDS